VKARFKVRPVNTTVVEGHSVMLHCVATGDPTPTIRWDRNNEVDAFDLQRFKVSCAVVKSYPCQLVVCISYLS